MRLNLKNKAFTLAEIMVVLTVIGVLSAILLPVAYNAAPDEDVMKFKKANATLGNVVREIVNSDKYFLDGDLGVRADGTAIDGDHDNDKTYLCSAIADILSVKSVNCSEYTEGITGHACLDWNDFDNLLDIKCANSANNVGPEIITTDGITIYQSSPGTTFNYSGALYDTDDLYFGSGAFYGKNSNGIGYRCAKVLCIDIDGIGEGEDPFGYALFVDGRLLWGTRANEWMDKSIQRGSND